MVGVATAILAIGTHQGGHAHGTVRRRGCGASQVPTARRSLTETVLQLGPGLRVRRRLHLLGTADVFIGQAGHEARHERADAMELSGRTSGDHKWLVCLFACSTHPQPRRGGRR